MTSAQTPPALEIKDLSYTYTEEWTRKQRHALKNLSLTVYQGEAFGFLGHNGAGKTTAIKAILNLIRAKSGTVSILGEDARAPRSRRSLGFLPEQPYFYDHLSVHETLHLYACLAGVPEATRESRISTVIERVGLKGRERSRLRSLSKGLTQRVALAQAIVASPAILILDEPFSGLDPLGRREFREILLEHKRQGCTIFMSSHILSDVEFLCDRASILVNGELKGVFDLRDRPSAFERTEFELSIRSSSDVSPLFPEASQHSELSGGIQRFTFSNEKAAQSALKVAIDRGISIDSFERLQSSLEELFMRIVEEARTKPAPPV